MLLNAMLSNSNVEKTKNALFFSAKTSNSSVSNILNPDISILSKIDDFSFSFLQAVEVERPYLFLK